MKKCTQCNFETDKDITFCPMCGAKIEAPAPVQAEPVVVAPVNPTPVNPTPVNPTPVNPVYTAPVVSAPVEEPSLAKKIVGMALSASALMLAIYCLFYTVSAMDYDGAFAFGYAIGFSIFSMPMGIVGLTMSNKNREQGDTSVFSLLGKIFGIVSVALTGLVLFIGFCGMVSSL